MEIQGKVIQLPPVQDGVGKNGNPWKVKPFIIETQERYPRKVYLEIFGDNLISQNPVELDAVVKVQFDAESREFNGRWYTSLRAWKVEDIGSAAGESATTTAAAPPAPAPTDNPPLPGMEGEETSDLPF